LSNSSSPHAASLTPSPSPAQAGEGNFESLRDEGKPGDDREARRVDVFVKQ
jgi:hypothetical protein